MASFTLEDNVDGALEPQASISAAEVDIRLPEADTLLDTSQEEVAVQADASTIAPLSVHLQGHQGQSPADTEPASAVHGHADADTESDQPQARQHSGTAASPPSLSHKDSGSAVEWNMPSRPIAARSAKQSALRERVDLALGVSALGPLTQTLRANQADIQDVEAKLQVSPAATVGTHCTMLTCPHSCTPAIK